MTQSPTIITDINGQQRKLGTLQPDPQWVKSLPVWEDQPNAEWTDAQILDAIRDPARVQGRKRFGRRWTQDQGSWGSCNGWASAGAYGRARFNRGFDDEEQYSGSWIYSFINGGADNGSNPGDDIQVGQETGFAELSLCPASQIYPSRQTRRAECLASASRHKGFQMHRAASLRGYRTALAQGNPVVIVVSAGPNFQRLTNGVAGVDGGRGNHAILADDLVMLTDRMEVSDCQNSWGPNYGDQGRCYLTMASFAQTFPVFPFIVIRSTQEGDG